MNIFITGLAGFLAGHIRDALVSQGHKVRGVDIVRTIDPNCIVGDCRNLDRMKLWIGDFNTDVVIHCAAYPHEGLSVFSPVTVGDSVYRGSVVTFTAAISCGVRRIVNCSSMSRYGAIRAPFDETDTPRPVDPYGIAKLAVEHTLEALAGVHGIEWVTAVPHNIFGPRQCRTDPYRNVVAIMMNMILNGKAPIIYGDGRQRRCFSYIDDVVPCFVEMAIGMNENMLGRAINVGPDSGDVNILQLVSMVSDVMGYRGAPMFYDARPAEVKHATCSGQLSREILGYQPQVSLRQGLERMAKWMKDLGPAPFAYHLPLEIITEATPKTWLNKEI